MSTENTYQTSKKTVEKKLGFYVHLFVFLLVNPILVLINFYNPTKIWFFYPLLFWGIGLFSHYLRVFPPKFITTIKQKMIEKELQKIEKNK